MNHLELYDRTCAECSQLITHRYSTSFSLGIRLFEASLRKPICAIYGFVRLADEIVDTFHHTDKGRLMTKFRADTVEALDQRISLNPVLHAYQQAVHRYGIEWELTDAFLRSMEMDLTDTVHDEESYEAYIYGSAEVVGLMCLRVFCHEQPSLYDNLKDHARSLGSAFQKINFLRDIKSDFQERGRVYFPGVDFNYFTLEDKEAIEADIKKDFDHGLEGIRMLPRGARLGVFLAYNYYIQLFRKIKDAPVRRVTSERIRVSDKRKAYLFFTTTLRHQLNFL